MEQHSLGSRIQNLDGTLAGIKPPLSKNQAEHAMSALNSVANYVVARGVLPPTFRPARDEFSNGATHVSHRNWGWLGRHNFIALISYHPADQQPLAVVAIIRSKTLPYGKQLSLLEKRRALSKDRVDAASEKNEVPRFRKYN